MGASAWTSPGWVQLGSALYHVEGLPVEGTPELGPRQNGLCLAQTLYLGASNVSQCPTCSTSLLPRGSSVFLKGPT
jgi:hypothetical protein